MRSLDKSEMKTIIVDLAALLRTFTPKKFPRTDFF